MQVLYKGSFQVNWKLKSLNIPKLTKTQTQEVQTDFFDTSFGVCVVFVFTHVQSLLVFYAVIHITWKLAAMSKILNWIQKQKV